jgi:hypothetical protein
MLLHPVAHLAGGAVLSSAPRPEGGAILLFRGLGAWCQGGKFNVSAKRAPGDTDKVN